MNDFGRILDEWDGMRSEQDHGAKKDSDFENMIDDYLPSDARGAEKMKGESDIESGGNNSSTRRSTHPRNWPIDASIDLHGMTAEAATGVLDVFFQQALSSGKRKLLIIHGKGLHSGGDPVLKKLVSRYLDGHKRAGTRGSADRKSGGSGATWVILK